MGILAFQQSCVCKFRVKRVDLPGPWSGLNHADPVTKMPTKFRQRTAQTHRTSITDKFLLAGQNVQLSVTPWT